MLKSLLIALLLILAAPAGAARTLYVPDDYNMIQKAINAAVYGDVVVVRPGTYIENIDFRGKAIVVKSEAGPKVTIIDGGSPSNPDKASCVLFEGREGRDSVLDGFTITNGTGMRAQGGGIFCQNYASPTIVNNRIVLNSPLGTNGRGAGISCTDHSSPLIENNLIADNLATGSNGGIEILTDSHPVILNNVITRNRAGYAAGIGSVQSSPTIVNNVITENVTFYQSGGGILLTRSPNVVITSNLIANNESAENGGGIMIHSDSDPVFVNNTLCNNRAAFYGGGIFMDSADPTVATNSIIWGNSALSGAEVYVGTKLGTSILTLDHCLVSQGPNSLHVETGCTLNIGPGTIYGNPKLAGFVDGDYHITAGSPCIDSGTRSGGTGGYFAVDFEGDPRIAAGAVDIGADEFFCHLYLTGVPAPGAEVSLHVVGDPGEPVTLFVGTGLAVAPGFSADLGGFRLTWPPLWFGRTGGVPGDGILEIPLTLPVPQTLPSIHALQALVGPAGGTSPRFTNVTILTIE
jgi:hypothetical protein